MDLTDSQPSTPAALEAFRLDGHVALITGAGRGIGARIASVYASAGARVALVARNEAELEATATELRSAGGSALVISEDLNDVTAGARIVERTVAEYGQLDVVVNNAGGAPPRRYLDTTPQALDEAFHYNVAATFELTKQATPWLLKSRRGSVINITSRMDRLASRGLMIYGTVKAAVAHMTRLMAVEMAPAIRVNAIAPGVVETEAIKSALDRTAHQQIVAATPLRRLASTTDVANAALWLASEAASYITGKIIEVDGGAEAPVVPDNIPDLTQQTLS